MTYRQTQTDLYTLLELLPTATPSEIKKVYYRLALQHHPDKHINSSQEERENATRKFQSLSFAYAVLNDPVKRKRYDKTGETDALQSLAEGEESLEAFFQELWKGVVNATSIEEFRGEYQGSEEERNDLLKAYKEHKGDMDLIMADVTCSSVEDEPRFIKTINDAIATKQLPPYQKFITTSSAKAVARRRKEAEREAKAAEKLAQEIGLNEKLIAGGAAGENSLKQIIQKRGEVRMDALIESLEQKYGKGGSSKKRKADETIKSEKKAKIDEFIDDEIDELAGDSNNIPSEEDEPINQVDNYKEPTEEEFRALQEKMFGKKKKSDDGETTKVTQEKLKSRNGTSITSKKGKSGGIKPRKK
ncbi:hypothetical protein G9A89_011058 [Geosiphon pyriformis]|nr:hypothetical protein G9A89_011058 [Geosiphon pyriformis]